MDAGRREAIERWFRRRGLPHFIDGRAATSDIWNRALPFLAVVFVLQSLNAINLEADWALWINALALLGGLGIAVGAWALLNRMRGEATFALPARAGLPELAVFVLVPPLIPLVFGAQGGSAAATAIANLFLVGVAYVVVSFGVISMMGWALGQLGRQFADVLAVVVRALPLLLLFSTFIFVNAEAWQFTGTLPWAVLGVVGFLLFLVGTLFAILKVPAQVSELIEPSTDDEMVELVGATPAQSLAISRQVDARLSRRQWGNVGLVILVTEGIQVAMVTVFVFAFFALFGCVAITSDVITSWTGSAPDLILTWTIGGHNFVLTGELLKVATFVALFSGLYFTVSLLTDATYRKEFLDELVGEVRQAFAVRVAYLGAITGANGP